MLTTILCIALILMSISVIILGYICYDRRLELERLRAEMADMIQSAENLIESSADLCKRNEAMEEELKACHSSIAWLLKTKDELRQKLSLATH